MYLKSIEVQGFKSFANKIVFDFHNGITGIVGPNGSGKSNVADAVRWVLGEQSAKQLRGSKMEDVIFAGTENRKPVGFAFVSITLDNSDHALPVDYDEVTVSRRVYRSGESEYLINGNSCRLKDVTEMFYDTGIGKEGYSIIGQGQIDKILSGKPDERRELFDEAAGIVKFKRRKATAIKKLENERANLVRVNDILSELEKQVGPLQVQSEKAKEYLDYKADLKKYDVNAFLLESDRISKDLEELTGKIGIADNDLANSRAEYESTKAEYEEAEEQLSKVNSDIENVNSLLSNTELESQRLNGEINVITEQINRFTDNEKHYSDRIAAIDKDKAAKQTNVADFKKQLEELSTSVEEFENNLKAKQDAADVIKQDIDGVSDQIESRQNDIYDRLNAKSSINAENQKFATMLEQLNIRKAELNSHLIKDKSDEAEQNIKINDISARLEAAQKNALEIAERIATNNDKVTAIKNENADLNAQHDKIVQNYHREKSRLESLINITERYDGYGNSIRKIMELKDSNSGILGVIADIVKVERKYETAIETALGGTIQNIVTDKESTAKELIAYLKQNKLGRATFLPLNAISGRNTLEKEPCIKENGVIGIASNLVRVSFEYENLAKYLLGRILVVDNIDNALLIAKKYKYSLRIVTLEGEQLNPGGSMTGGAFKNSSNLLGRRREIEELKKSVSELSKSSTELKTKIADNRAKIASIRELIDADNKANREVSLAVNTEQMNLNQAKQKLSEIRIIYDKDKAETTEIDRQIKEIDENKNQVSGSLSALDIQNESSRKEIENLNKQLEAKKAELDKANDDIENLKIRFSSVEQKTAFIQENIPHIANNSFFMALYISRKVRDVLVYTLFLLIVFALIPAALYLLPVIPAYVPVIYAGVMGILLLIVGRSVYINLILAHKDTIMAARDTRYKIRDNKRIIKKTQHSIKKDKDEAMYGLESFDNRINSICDNIKKTEEEKQNALREFEETVKPDLVKEVEGRYLDKLNLMREELAKKKDEYMKLDDLIKQQRIYISSNYEAYLGKEFVNVQRLTELDNIISSGEAQTISQAMAVYKNRK